MYKGGIWTDNISETEISLSLYGIPSVQWPRQEPSRHLGPFTALLCWNSIYPVECKISMEDKSNKLKQTSLVTLCSIRKEIRSNNNFRWSQSSFEYFFYNFCQIFFRSRRMYNRKWLQWVCWMHEQRGIISMYL